MASHTTLGSNKIYHLSIKNMKKLTLLLAVLACSLTISLAQTFPAPDKSPMDMAYYPHNFAHDRSEGEKALVRVTYSRPAKNGREVFGKLVPYGKVWRVGANEATEIKFYSDVTIKGEKVTAGTYSLFAIPGEKEWTIILNSDLDYWGAYSYNEKNDVIRISVPALVAGETVENFAIRFSKNGNNGAMMRMGWDKTMVEVPLEF